MSTRLLIGLFREELLDKGLCPNTSSKYHKMKEKWGTIEGNRPGGFILREDVVSTASHLLHPTLFCYAFIFSFFLETCLSTPYSPKELVK